MKSKVFIIVAILAFVVAGVANATLTVTGSWGQYPKLIQGDDGGKWLSWNLGNLASGAGAALGLADDSSIFYPNGDGTWSITLKYSPGYTISQFKILYADTKVASRAEAKNAALSWDNHYQENFGNVRSLTIPITAAGSYVYEVNWNDTPWALGATTFVAQPDSGAIVLYWSAQVNDGIGYGDVDSSDTGDSYGYRIYRSTAAGGPYEPVADVNGSTTSYLNKWNVTATGNYSSLVSGYGYKLVDTAGIVNGTTYYYIIFAVDAYSVQSDTSSEISQVPRAWIDVIFTVEGIDWNKVTTKFKHIVWATPWRDNRAYFFNKVPAKITAVYVPKS